MDEKVVLDKEESKADNAVIIKKKKKKGAFVPIEEISSHKTINQESDILAKFLDSIRDNEIIRTKQGLQ
jgi:hypothetical protein